MLTGFRETRAPSPHVRARVEEVRAYLEANMTGHVDMVSVARQVALSPFYLNRIFKAQYGSRPTGTSSDSASTMRPTFSATPC
jgi:AraC-like DNA-binding protein